MPVKAVSNHPSQIHNACRQANDLDMRMVNAVAVRQVLDLKIGAAFTRLMTMTLQTRMAEEFTKKVVSYGKSQRKSSVVVMKEC